MGLQKAELRRVEFQKVGLKRVGKGVKPWRRASDWMVRN